MRPPLARNNQRGSIQEPSVIGRAQRIGNRPPEPRRTFPAQQYSGPGQILRFKESERFLHWAIAAPFLLCWITALILEVVYNPEPTRPLRALLSWTHRIGGSLLIMLPMLALIRGRKDLRLHLYNVKTAWRWYAKDLQWLALMLPAALIKRIGLPEQHKFNAAEKINFILVMIVCPILAVTGLMMWVQKTTWIAWLIHVSLAAMITPVTLGHVYMALVNPETRKGLTGMFSGFVDRHWAEHHYALWYKEHVIPSERRNGVRADHAKSSSGSGTLTSRLIADTTDKPEHFKAVAGIATEQTTR